MTEYTFNLKITAVECLVPHQGPGEPDSWRLGRVESSSKTSGPTLKETTDQQQMRTRTI